MTVLGNEVARYVAIHSIRRMRFSGCRRVFELLACRIASRTDEVIPRRVTIVADPDPPANQASWSYNSASGPSLPPMVQPIVGTGDAKTVKEAEKLAALHACMQLAAKGLFTSVRPAFPASSCQRR